MSYLTNFRTLAGLTAISLIVLIVNSAYIAAFASPTIFYMGNVMVHLVLGTALAVAFVWLLVRDAVMRRELLIAAALFFFALLAAGYLLWRGNLMEHRWAFWGHIATALLGICSLTPFLWKRAQLGGGWLQLRNAFIAAVAFLVLLPSGTSLYSRIFPDPASRIRNPTLVPTSMHEEGGGPNSPFFPSSSQTDIGGIIPSNFFMDSKRCGECHKDIYEQWNSSSHHFASFNNQFYRKSIEYMQDVVGTQPSKWCAGCHDHAMFFNGRFDKPVKEQIDTPEAQNGLGCMSCHSIAHVKSTTGNGDFVVAYPPLHELANSNNPIIHQMDRFLTFLNPAPHRATFLKPFMRQDSAEFCSSCHKVHLDVPVNQYRWFRGFNDYDNWQASGVSGQGARSFYYPEKSMTCNDCHMPMLPSKDPGNIKGKVHSHRFAAANTALAHVNQDKEQMDAVVKNLQSGFISVDIFAVSPVTQRASDTRMVRRSAETPQIMSSFAVGEEAEQNAASVIREVGELAAPVESSVTTLEPGKTVRVDVVVRTRKIGHFFPGGTVDAFDVWLELQARDADGETIFWSGRTDDGNGPVESGAHFYRSYQLDAEGNPINKRNAYQTRSVLYVRLIPPGAADVAHYQITVPPKAKGPIRLTAKLNYRKFSHYYNKFAYAGQPKPGQNPADVGPGHNNLEYSFDKANIPANVSGKIKGTIPDLPIITLATSEKILALGTPQWKPLVRKADRERWNDWGIGLLLQGDLKAAEFAFRRVTEADTNYADGWLNVARALIQEGETDAAKPFLQKALDIDSNLGRIHFFQAMVQKADGDYDAAIRSLRIVEQKYPRDRVALNQLARILFLKREYAAALEVLTRVCLVDPEDLQMHYTMMLCYRGLGDRQKEEREATLFRRFKADESAQNITAKRRLVSPEDNNERQTIHDHESVPLKKAPMPPRRYPEAKSLSSAGNE